MNFSELIMSLEMGIIYGIVAIGIYLTFRIIDFPDLTCDGSFVLGACTSSMLIKAGYNPFLALFFAAIAGGLAGLLTGILHTRLKITNLLSGILVAFMLYSINLKIMGGIPNVTLVNETTIFSNHNPLLILTIIGGLTWLLISYLLITDFGLSFRSLGYNKNLALHSGINLKQMIMMGLSLSNGLIGFGGALFSQHLGFSDISIGVGTVIVGLASVMIGERCLPFRAMWFKIASCLMGSIVYRILVALALHSEWLGLQTQDLNLITGILVILIMLLPYARRCRGGMTC